MSLPGTDVYYTHIKTKYISGFVVSSNQSVATAGEGTIYSSGSLRCDKVIEIADEGGTTYYIPAFSVSNT